MPGLAGIIVLLLGAPGESREWTIDVGSLAPGQGFTAIGRGISVRDGALRLAGCESKDASVFLDGPELRFEEAAFDFRIDFLYVHLDRHEQLILVRSDGKSSWNEIARKGGLSYRTGEWHRLRVSLAGGALRAEVDGRPGLEREGIEAGPGRLGFYVSDGCLEVRGLRVRGAPAPLDPSWRRLPERFAHVVVCSDGGAGGYEAFPDVRLLESGELLCVFYAGFSHVSLPGYGPGGKLPPACPRAGRIALVRSRDLGRTWSAPEVVVDTPLDDRDPSIVELAGGELLVAYFSLDSGPGGSGYRFVTSSVVRSSNGGKTWSAPQALFPDWAVSSPPRVLSDGRLALPVYYVGEVKSPGRAYGGVSFSKDAGRAWSAPVPVGREGPLELDAEPDLVELPGGKLLMALRPILAFSSSDDDGRTWSAPARAGFEGHCPYFLRLRSGILLLAHRLPGTSLHASLDEGRSWGPNVLIDDVGGAYPSLCELPPPLPEGTCLAVYYEEGPGSDIRARRFRTTREGVEWLDPTGN
jgi:sialidase-1